MCYKFPDPLYEMYENPNEEGMLAIMSQQLMREAVRDRQQSVVDVFIAVGFKILDVVSMMRKSIARVWSRFMRGFSQFCNLVRGSYAYGALVGIYAVQDEILHVLYQAGSESMHAFANCLMQSNDLYTPLTASVGQVTKYMTYDDVGDLSSMKLLCLLCVVRNLTQSLRQDRLQANKHSGTHRRLVGCSRCNVINSQMESP